MPYRIEKKTLDDINSSRKAIGIKLPFSSDSVFMSTHNSSDACKANLLCFLLTGKGERPDNPEFGSSLPKYLFEPNVEANVRVLEKVLSREIASNFSRVIVDELHVTSDKEYTLQLYLKFHIKDTPIEDELILNYE